MSLSRNTWKFLPPYVVPLFSQSRVDGLLNGIWTLFNTSSYADGSARVTGSGLAWTFFRTSSADSASVIGPTAVVYGYPPTMSVMSQSVIFAGTASAPTALPTMVPGGSFVANGLYLAIQKQANSFQYRSWLSGSIFNSGSSGINLGGLARSSSGFAPIMTTMTAIGIIHAWECQDSVAVACYTTSSGNTANALTFAGIAGAFVDPESVDTVQDAETDGRLYSVATSGVTVGTTFLASTTDFLNHNATAASSKFVTYQPNTDNRIALFTVDQRTMSYLNTTPSGRIITFPMYVRDNNSRFIGRLREIEAMRNAASGYIFRSGSVDAGYSLGSTNLAVQNSVFLGAI